MSDRHSYQREVAQLLEELQRQNERRYRLEAAGARAALLEDDARERLARLIDAA